MQRFLGDGAFFLAAAVLLGGCAPKTAKTDSNGKIILRVMQDELENRQMDFPNLWFCQELEKKPVFMSNRSPSRSRTGERRSTWCSLRGYARYDSHGRD
jgi:hypothetical protein